MGVLKITFSVILFFIVFHGYTQEETDPCTLWEKKTDKITDLDEGFTNSRLYLTKVSQKCKIKVYVEIANLHLRKLHLDSAVYYMDTAITLGKKLNADEELVLAYTEKTNILISQNKYDEVNDLLKKSRTLLERHPNSSAWIHYYDKKGFMEYVRSEYYTALEYMDSTIIVAERNGSFTKVDQTYEHKGVLYMNLSEYEKAAENFILSLESMQKNGNFQNLSSTYRYLGSCFFKLKQYPKAKDYLLKAMEFGKANNDDHAVMISYFRLATNNRLMNLNEEAEIAVDHAIKMARKTKTNKQIALALEEKGLLYLHNYKKYDQAEKYFLEAYDFAKKAEQQDAIYGCLQSMTALYVKKKDQKKLKEFVGELARVTENGTDLAQIAYLEKARSQYYEIANQSKKALVHLKAYHKLHDSITSKEVSGKVANLEKQYDTKKKELTIASLNKEKDEQRQVVAKAKFRQKLYLLAAVLLLFLLGLGIWAFRKLRKQQKELTSTNQVKNRLFSIIAHDLRGMIIPFQRSGKILKHHIDKGNQEKTIELSQELEKNSESLSNMLDNLLNWSLEQMNGYRMQPEPIAVGVQLQEIITGFGQQALYKNTNIELRFEEDVVIKFDKGAFHVIFRNLLGNALKYTENGNIRVEFKKNLDVLSCSVIDTGVGMSEDQLQHIFTLEEGTSTVGTQGEKGTGLGLNLVYRFVQMNNGNIKVSSEKRIGTRFDLSFPIIQANTQTDIPESMSA